MENKTVKKSRELGKKTSGKRKEGGRRRVLNKERKHIERYMRKWENGGGGGSQVHIM